MASFENHVHENPFSQAGSFDDVCDVLGAIADENGLPFFAYLHLRGTDRTDRFIANYPLEWRRRYEQKLYIHYDPVVAVGQQSRLPFFWDNAGFIRPYGKAQQRVFHEAGEHGIKFGYAIPIAGRDGDLGLFTLAARSERTLIAAMAQSGHQSYVLGLQLHDHILTLSGQTATQTANVELTARELECLKWAAEGLTTELIAERMFLSAATVNYHFSKIVPKFDAANRHHAVIKAVRLGLV